MVHSVEGTRAHCDCLICFYTACDYKIISLSRSLSDAINVTELTIPFESLSIFAVFRISRTRLAQKFHQSFRVTRPLL